MTRKFEDLRALGRLALKSAIEKAERSGGLDGSEPDSNQRPDALVSPAAIIIEYQGASDSTPATRTVILRRVWPAIEFVRMAGFCTYRAAVREFRSDRISSLACAVTGEVADDPEAWLRAHALFDDNASNEVNRRAFYSARDELVLLAFLAKSDGHLDADELEVMVDHVMLAAPPGPFDRERAALRIRRIAPDFDDVERAAARIAGNPDRFNRLKRTARRLMEADGELPADEQTAWAAILNAAGESLTRRQQS